MSRSAESNYDFEAVLTRSIIEGAEITELQRSRIEHVLKRHTADLPPTPLGEGSRELRNELSGDLLGAAEAEIDRSDPPLYIKRLRILQNKLLALVGPNGAGKTTLFDGLMNRDNAAISIESTQGARVIGNSLKGRDNLRIARLDQEEQLRQVEEVPAQAIVDIAAEYFKRDLPSWESPDSYGEDIEKAQAGEDARARIDFLKEQAVTLLEMTEFLDRRVSELSGGEISKLALLMIILSEADVMLLDEPTNHLDLESIAKLTGLLGKYSRSGVGIICSSHVESFLDQIGRDGTMEIAWDGKQRTLNSSNSPYHNFKRDRSKIQAMVLSGGLDWPTQEIYNHQNRGLVTVPEGFSISESPLQEIKNMPSINTQDFIVITGKNGTGKSKLMQVLANNRNRGELPRLEKGVLVGYLPQNWPPEVSKGSLKDFILWVINAANRHDENAFRLTLRRMKDKQFGGKRNISETDIAKLPLDKLSGGEQRLLWFLTISSVAGVEMLILDEPTNHMDFKARAAIVESLQKFKGGVVLSTHDNYLLEALSDEAGLQMGQIRQPLHINLVKSRSRTQLSVSDEKLRHYVKRLSEEGQRAAKQFKIE
jgi:ATP-binding cassette, subfamily F, member 3